MANIALQIRNRAIRKIAQNKPLTPQEQSIVDRQSGGRGTKETYKRLLQKEKDLVRQGGRTGGRMMGGTTRTYTDSSGKKWTIISSSRGFEDPDTGETGKVTVTERGKVTVRDDKGTKIATDKMSVGEAKGFLRTEGRRVADVKMPYSNQLMSSQSPQQVFQSQGLMSIAPSQPQSMTLASAADLPRTQGQSGQMMTPIPTRYESAQASAPKWARGTPLVPIAYGTKRVVETTGDFFKGMYDYVDSRGKESTPESRLFLRTAPVVVAPLMVVGATTGAVASAPLGGLGGNLITRPGFGVTQSAYKVGGKWFGRLSGIGTGIATFEARQKTGEALIESTLAKEDYKYYQANKDKIDNLVRSGNIYRTEKYTDKAFDQYRKTNFWKSPLSKAISGTEGFLKTAANELFPGTTPGRIKMQQEDFLYQEATKQGLTPQGARIASELGKSKDTLATIQYTSAEDFGNKLSAIELQYKKVGKTTKLIGGKMKDFIKAKTPGAFAEGYIAINTLINKGVDFKIGSEKLGVQVDFGSPKYLPSKSTIKGQPEQSTMDLEGYKTTTKDIDYTQFVDYQKKYGQNLEKYPLGEKENVILNIGGAMEGQMNITRTMEATPDVTTYSPGKIITGMGIGALSVVPAKAFGYLEVGASRLSSKSKKLSTKGKVTPQSKSKVKSNLYLRDAGEPAVAGLGYALDIPEFQGDVASEKNILSAILPFGNQRKSRTKTLGFGLTGGTGTNLGGTKSQGSLTQPSQSFVSPQQGKTFAFVDSKTTSDIFNTQKIGTGTLTEQDTFIDTKTNEFNEQQTKQMTKQQEDTLSESYSEAFTTVMTPKFPFFVPPILPSGGGGGGAGRIFRKGTGRRTAYLPSLSGVITKTKAGKKGRTLTGLEIRGL